MSETRRQVLRYVICTFAISFAFQAWMIWQKSMSGALVLMAIPALVSFALRALGREGFRDVGWRAGPLRYWVLAFVVPALCAAFTYLGAWSVGGIGFSPRPSANPSSPLVRFLVSAAINAPLAALIGFIPAAGEEIGWRGYLLTRMVSARIALPLFWSGVIWGVWHLPLIVFGQYASSPRPLVSAGLFMITITLAAHFVGWLRLASGSVWPAVVFHAAHNSFYQAVFDPWFGGANEPYLAGEAGIFSIAAYAIVTLVLWKGGYLR